MSFSMPSGKKDSVHSALFGLGGSANPVKEEARPLERIATLSPFGAYVTDAPAGPGKFEVIETGIRKIQDLASLMNSADVESAPRETAAPPPDVEILFDLKGETAELGEPQERSPEPDAAEDFAEDSILGWAETLSAPYRPSSVNRRELNFASYSDAELWSLYMRYAEELRRCGRSMSVPGFAAFCSRLQAIVTHFVEANQTDQFRFQLRVSQGRPYIIASVASSPVQHP